MTSKDTFTQKSALVKASVNFEEEKTTSSTLKRNQKMELNKTDLLRLLSYLEGELQARDIVIATLKAEKVKRLLSPGRFWLNSTSDPRAALQRDAFGGTDPVFDEDHMQSLADRQIVALDNYVLQHRKMVSHMAKLMKEMEDRHTKVVQDLEDEKRKHEHDTAQGDDITYGLEKERLRLRQELELEINGRKKAEKDLKKFLDMFDEEKARTKSIVLLLIAERKKALVKYIEERKRSEDLAQILAEEKGRIDAMAEGLEEESKKSLQMEAELERQLAEFDTERQQLRATIAKEEKRFKELELEAERHRGEADNLKKQLVEAHHVAMFQAGTTGLCPRPPHPPVKPTVIPPQSVGSTRPALPQSGIPLVQSKVWSGTPAADGSVSPPPNAMLSSVAKVVQPTATVSSVPVCAPTTGIARSVSPGQGVRNNAFPAQYSGQHPVQPNATTTREQIWTGDQQATNPQVAQGKAAAQPAAVSPRVALQTTPGTKVFATATTEGSKFSFRVMANPAEAGQSTVKKGPVGSRGFPPPIPPNKPVVPPKKDTVRRSDVDPKVAADPISIKYKAVHCPEVHDEDAPRREPQETCS